MTTTRRRLSALGISLLLGAAAVAGCSSDNSSDSAGDTTSTTVAQETTTTTAAASAAATSGSASCTEADMAKAAEPTNAGATVTEITCNSLNSRAAATVKDQGSCAQGCVGYFVADNGAWKLVGVQPEADPIDATAYSEWNTLHISWKNKLDAVKNPPVKSDSASSSGSTGSGGERPADGTEPTVPTQPKSSFCTYYGPVPACVLDPMYMPPTIPPATEPPPEGTPPAP
jgi:hypothetical protein